MAFPTTSTLDDFNRANAADIGANWTPDAFWGNVAFQLTGNQVTGTNLDGFHSEYWNPITPGPDSEVFATIATRPNDLESLRLGLRIQQPGSGAGTADGYTFQYERDDGAAGDSVRIYRNDNEVETQLGATITQDFANGDSFGGEAIGTTIAVYRKPAAGSWGSLGSRTDATYGSSGRIGMAGYSNVFRLDDFGGGTVVAAGAVRRARRMLMGVGR